MLAIGYEVGKSEELEECSRWPTVSLCGASIASGSPGRFSVGCDAAWLVVSRASPALKGHGAFSWLALVWVFEVVFALTVTPMWSWCREDHFTPRDPQLGDHAFEQFWADALRPDRRTLG